MTVYSILRINITMIIILCACLVSSSLATPPEMPPTWDDPVLAYVVFPAGRYPDDQGRFEVEVFCEAVYDVQELTLSVGFTEEITFDGDAPHFEGSLKKGKSKVWRIKGTVSAISPEDDLGMPAAINLIVKYRFPYRAVLKEIEKRNDQGTSYAMQRIEKEKGEMKMIMKALPVEIPEPGELRLLLNDE